MRILILLVLAVLIGGLFFVVLTRSHTESTPTAEQLKQDAQRVGEDLKTAAQEAATQIRPRLDEAKETAREAVHDAAQKLAEKTATQPASRPE